jgi:hypothetical protein
VTEPPVSPVHSTGGSDPIITPGPPAARFETPGPTHGAGSVSMINQLVRAALQEPLLVGLAVVALVGVGIWSFTRLPVDAYPDL